MLLAKVVYTGLDAVRTLQFDPTKSVEEALQLIMKKYPVKDTTNVRVKLLYDGNVLENDRSLDTYNIPKFGTIEAVSEIAKWNVLPSSAGERSRVQIGKDPTMVRKKQERDRIRRSLMEGTGEAPSNLSTMRDARVVKGESEKRVGGNAYATMSLLNLRGKSDNAASIHTYVDRRRGAAFFAALESLGAPSALDSEVYGGDIPDVRELNAGLVRYQALIEDVDALEEVAVEDEGEIEVLSVSFATLVDRKRVAGQSRFTSLDSASALGMVRSTLDASIEVCGASTSTTVLIPASFTIQECLQLCLSLPALSNLQAGYYGALNSKGTLIPLSHPEPWYQLVGKAESGYRIVLKGPLDDPGEVGMQTTWETPRKAPKEPRKGPICTPSPGYSLGKVYPPNDIPADYENQAVEASALDASPYVSSFASGEHLNFLGRRANEEAVVVTIDLYLAGEDEFRVLVWWETHSEIFKVKGARRKQMEAIRESNNAAQRYRRGKALLGKVAASIPGLKGAKFFREVDADRAHTLLAEMETRQLVRDYKFGVLYARPGQAREEELFGNREGSARFYAFMDCLGERTPLRGWQGYRGGLNVVDDSTGKESYYTEFDDFNIMYHVSTMMPFSETNPQQLDRKRHIGNDIVVVVFIDGDNAAFDPSCLVSEFNHIFVIVQALPDVEPFSVKVSVAVKQGVDVDFKPYLVEEQVFEVNRQFRKTLLCKMINGERAAYLSPMFAKKIVRTRQLLLRNVIAECVSNHKKVI